VDQGGSPRPNGGACDIGACEGARSSSLYNRNLIRNGDADSAACRQRAEQRRQRAAADERRRGFDADQAVRIGERGVPFLKDVPVLGNLFKHEDTERVKTNLLVFLTLLASHRFLELPLLASTVPVGLFLYSLKTGAGIDIFNPGGFHRYMECLGKSFP
jgi:hypothetical protein